LLLNKKEQIILFTFTFSTPSPTASTTPAHSEPKMKGGFDRQSRFPCLINKSGKLSPLKNNKKRAK